MSIKSFAVVVLATALLTPVAALAGDDAGKAGPAAAGPMEHHGHWRHHRHHRHHHHHGHGGHAMNAEDPGHTGGNVHPMNSTTTSPH